MTTPRRTTYLLEGLLGVASALAVLFLVFGGHRSDEWDVLPRGVAGLPLYLTWLLVIAGGLYAVRRNFGWGWLVRVPLYAMAAVLLAVAVRRVQLERLERQSHRHWPPRVADNLFHRLDTFDRQAAVIWAARVAQHRLITDSTSWSNDSAARFTMPASWAFPLNGTVAVVPRGGDTVQVWARLAEGQTACVARPARTMKDECGPGATAPATGFRPVTRVPDVAPPPVPSIADGPHRWLQYRRDAARLATSVETDSVVTSWRTRIDGPVRSTISVAGEVALVGAHGTGTVQALDVHTGKTRWTSRVPNWVHMDIVSDGRVAVVGFGDNAYSFYGAAPSGVSEYDVQSGQLRWTRFDESSVMSGAVIHDDVIVYGNAMGLIKKLAIDDGRLLGVDTLGGSVTMAPPAMVGDTLVFTLEHDRVCALLISTMHTLWCRQVPGARLMGHAAPAVADGRVMVTTALTASGIHWREFRALPTAQQWKLVRTAFFPEQYNELAGERVVAYRLRDGATLWETPLARRIRTVSGHEAGTAAVADSVGVIVLPEADIGVGFDPRDGHVRWAAPTFQSRGPLLLVLPFVILSRRDGQIEVRDAVSGALSCSMKESSGYDRAGATLVNGMVLLADQNGGIESMSLDDVLHCRSHMRAPR
jgi:outer membrane protein assembly factor BamB